MKTHDLTPAAVEMSIEYLNSLVLTGETHVAALVENELLYRCLAAMAHGRCTDPGAVAKLLLKLKTQKFLRPPAPLSCACNRHHLDVILGPESAGAPTVDTP